jgi:hypothetical protein
MTDLLKQYAELQTQLLDLQAQIADVTAAIELEVAKSGAMQAHGVKAFYKPGRKTTDHEAAYTVTLESSDMTSRDELEAIAQKHTTTKVTVAWAKVTKDAGIDTAPYTTESTPTFVIDFV